MNPEKIKVQTEDGKTLEVVVYSKRAGSIEVVLGEGMHSMKCTLVPTRSGKSYVGRIMGREIEYRRSQDDVQADIDRLNPNVRGPRAR